MQNKSALFIDCEVFGVNDGVSHNILPLSRRQSYCKFLILFPGNLHIVRIIVYERKDNVVRGITEIRIGVVPFEKMHCLSILHCFGGLSPVEYGAEIIVKFPA